jgi:hypothetical protein
MALLLGEEWREKRKTTVETGGGGGRGGGREGGREGERERERERETERERERERERESMVAQTAHTRTYKEYEGSYKEHTQ